jgi:uncharacterized membrane protein YkgB
MAKYILAWFGLMVIAVINGVVREATYKKALGDLAAHQLSTLIGIILFGVYIWIIIGKWRPRSASQAIMIGVLWLAMTLAFEFLAGHYVFGNPWPKILHDYNLLAGRLWILVLIWVTIAPYLVYRLRK